MAKKTRYPGIYEIGRNHYSIWISMGKDPVTGKYKQSTHVFHGTLTEARKFRADLIRQRDNGIDLEAGKITFAEFARRFAERRIINDNLSGKTADGYRYALNRVIPVIGHVRIKDITPLMLEDMLSGFKAEGLSNTTIRRFYQFVKAVLSQAVDYGLILRNPAEKVKPPKKEKPNRNALTIEQASALLEYIEWAEFVAYEAEQAKEARQREDGLFERGYIQGIREISCWTAVRIALATGMRRGEYLALTWDDIDFERGTVRVSKTITAKMVVKEPKTESSNRTISLDAHTLEALRGWRETQSAEFAKVGFTVKGDTPICCSSKGGYINPDNFSHWWAKVRIKCDLDGWTLHELRHTQITILISQGIDPKTVQERVGHKDSATTMDVYAHFREENDREAANIFGELLENPEKARCAIRS